ncbi:MAG: bifunctional methylenetetrahydrofolate dehydrogenase/methenyltetrahydrofolate cyclohydrolase FolD [Planctomycetaceae bacterium]|nr:bifunctional methylenetetrahydrofolate dehydrogenase/methenyltetrahydrofolate cyclohydrolase FolD [Planctomycetaceae bacterium]
MTATLLDGKALAKELQAELAGEVRKFTTQSGVTPTLAAVLVGNNPASEAYVKNKRLACERVGMASQLHRLAESVSEVELLELVAQLNRDPAVHGILVQLPLPKQINGERVLDAVTPLKDVDAFHPENVGLLMQGRPRYLPCTPSGVVQILSRGGIEIPGRHVVILGRSDIVGKPMAMMLVQRGPLADATVTVCHSRTKELSTITKQADILIVAIGQPRFVTAEMVKPGATVIDVGINRVDDKLVGDVDFDGVKEVAGKLTPVPGGVGPLTVTMLMFNTLTAARLQSQG